MSLKTEDVVAGSTLDELLEMLKHNRRSGQMMTRQYNELKERRSVILAELNRRGLCVKHDFFNEED